MKYLEFRRIIDEARAHGLAVQGANTRQVFVNVQFYQEGAKLYGFAACMGACPKCDRLWIELRRSLASVKVVEVRSPEAPAPSEPVELSN